jgi:hypoxanthine phosphoribosyltransferase
MEKTFGAQRLDPHRTITGRTPSEDPAQSQEPKGRQHILKLGWETIHTMVETLALMIEPLKPHLLVGVQRGGLVPTTLLSHKLNIPMDVISASAYEGTRRTLQKPINIVGWRAHYNNPGVIVVDDIMDTGDTYFHILAEHGVSTKFKFATLIYKTPNRFSSFDRYVMQVPKETWVQFPWEQAES